jgi:hypothetical protein
MNTNVILEKGGLQIIKTAENIYNAICSIENTNIILPNIIDFNLIKLMYQLNGDIYEKIDMDIINDNEATCIFLIKHFFEDIGIPQKYSHIFIKKIIEKDSITFLSQTVAINKPDFIPTDAVLLKIKNMICKCDIITPHKIDFNVTIIFENNLNMPAYAEKIMGAIIHKIFIRIKQFIEKINCNI